jgi:hypothetical protein
MKQPMLAGVVVAAIETQKINSGIYFAAAAVLIFVAAMLSGRKVQRNLKAKRQNGSQPFSPSAW